MNSSPKAIVLSTLISSSAVAGMAAWRGRAEGLTGWRPVNAISHIVWGPAAGSQNGLTLRYTGLGLLLNGIACGFWSWLYERRREFSSQPRSPRSPVNDALGAVGIAIVAYVTELPCRPASFHAGLRTEPVASKLSLALRRPGSRPDDTGVVVSRRTK